MWRRAGELRVCTNWVRRTPNGRGEQCAAYVSDEAEGAIRVLSDEAVEAVFEYLNLHTPKEAGYSYQNHIVHFNDHFARDQYHVAEVLEKTAANL